MTRIMTMKNYHPAVSLVGLSKTFRCRKGRRGPRTAIPRPSTFSTNSIESNRPVVTTMSPLRRNLRQTCTKACVTIKTSPRSEARKAIRQYSLRSNLLPKRKSSNLHIEGLCRTLELLKSKKKWIKKRQCRPRGLRSSSSSRSVKVIIRSSEGSIHKKTK